MIAIGAAIYGGDVISLKEVAAGSVTHSITYSSAKNKPSDKTVTTGVEYDATNVTDGNADSLVHTSIITSFVDTMSYTSDYNYLVANGKANGLTSGYDCTFSIRMQVHDL